MPPRPPRLSQGSVVWAEVADPRGNIKRRPLVIVTATDEIVLDQPIVAVAITTTYPEPPPRNCVPLPWSPHRHPATRLARRSAAVCDWLIQVLPSDIELTGGYVPARTMLRILECLQGLGSDGG